tara:strand:+ start:9496 stop:13593 length:4098 start_codon:yes stop_codon:yes gene_type:complete
MSKNQRVTYTYRGMNQDVTLGKHPTEFYYTANNIRIMAGNNNTTGSATNELGNSVSITIPTVSIDRRNNVISWNGAHAGSLSYRGHFTPEINNQLHKGLLPSVSNTQIIIGHTTTRNSIILFTTSNIAGRTEVNTSQMDCIWEVTNLFEDTYDLKLLYCRNLGFNKNNPIQALFNYENDIIQKVYWVDGNKQIRFINIKHSIENGDTENLIDIHSNTINAVSNFKLNQPSIIGLSSGGTHTSGKIQYAYNLYKLNSSQTKHSPLSELIPIGKGVNLGGGEVNEVVGLIPIVNITSIDSDYTHIKIYAIKYTSYNELPSVDVIYHAELNEDDNVVYYDDGSVIESVSLEEFLFLGSDPIIPEHIETKDSILFCSNYKEVSFDVDLDFRAYSFLANQTGSVWDTVIPSGDWVVGNEQSFTPGDYSNIGVKSDAVNLLYGTQKYQSDGVTLGGEGQYIKYAFISTLYPDDEVKELEFFKDDEIYRIAIQFYNKLGQTSFPKWIADIRAPITNFTGRHTKLRVDLKPSFALWLSTNSNFETEDDKPIGYKIIRADRQIGDRSILCQGMISGMMARTTDKPREYDHWLIPENRREESNELVKFPQPITRGFNDIFVPFKATNHLEPMQDSGGSAFGSLHWTEIWEATSRNNKRQHAWQYTKMMQLYSPEILFNTGIGLGAGLKLDIKGLAVNTKNDAWYKKINTGSLQDSFNEKYDNINHMVDDSDLFIHGIFGPSNKDNLSDQLQINREYHDFVPSSNKVNREVYGSPEITERGQGSTSYNNNSDLKYTNSMRQFATDQADSDEENKRAITTMNSFGVKCITVVEGTGTSTIEQRKGVEDLYSFTGIAETNGSLIAEIRIPEVNIYIGNLYGGNSYESKHRNTYIEIGNYNDVSTLTSNIKSPGDTFFYNFKVARIAKTDTESIDDQVIQLTNTISFMCESTIDMKNRNDQSIFGWDGEFQPRDENYHKYNRVYSQQPTLVQNSSDDFNFKKIKDFDTRVISSKVKVPGEGIDNWTDFQINSTLDLDGKYGAINSMVNWNDEIYTIQDSGVAKLSINPRVQVQAGDGVGIELGTGAVLYNYQYLTSTSGSINKWGVAISPSGLYYYDALNKSINKVGGKGLIELSNQKGMHSFLENNSTYADIVQDNPLIGAGALMSFDHINNDVYLTLHQGEKTFTLAFNEKTDSFVSFYDYHPSMYISKGFKLLSINIDKNILWEHFKGQYNNFYGVQYSSLITLIVNPQNRDCVFNNMDWKSKVYNADNTLIGSPIETDIHNETLTSIRVYNEYQHTRETPLVLNSNISRKFRVWSCNIPRALDADGNPTLDRMRGHWIYVDLIFDPYSNTTGRTTIPTFNRRLVLDDISINYTSH